MKETYPIDHEPELVDWKTKKNIYNQWVKECKKKTMGEGKKCFQKICKRWGDFNKKEMEEIIEYCFPEVLI